MPTTFKSDKLYDLVFCVCIVSNDNPKTDSTLPIIKLTKNGPIIMHAVPI